MNFDLEKLTKAADWLLTKATVFTGITAAIGAAGWVLATAAKLPWFGLPESSHDTLDKLGLRFLILWLILAVLTIIVKIQKHTKQSAAIAAEQIRRNPTLDNVSAVPEVNKQIIKQTVEGAVVEPSP